jgi:hypothetical protein
MIYHQRFKTTEQRFWEKVDKRSADECWPWIAGRNSQGYGAFYWNHKRGGAHRFSYEMHNGPVSGGMELDHLCRNRLCVNPAHLESVPKAVNILRGDGAPARCARKTHCPKGHEYDEANTIHYRGGRYCRACQSEKNNSEAHRRYCRERYHRLKREHAA